MNGSQKMRDERISGEPPTASVIKTLLADQSRGATSLYRDSLDYFSGLLDAQLKARLRQESNQLKTHFNAMGLFRRLAEDVGSIESPQEMRQLLEKRLEQIALFPQLTAQHCLRELPQSAVILTISSSAMVEQALEKAAGGNKLDRVICLLSEPGGEGGLMAESLKKSGICAECIPDDQIESGVKRSHLILCGCDLWTATFFINKRGTLRLSQFVADLKKPFWVLGDRLRYCPKFPVKEKIGPLFEAIPFTDNLRLFTESGEVNRDFQS